MKPIRTLPLARSRTLAGGVETNAGGVEALAGGVEANAGGVEALAGRGWHRIKRCGTTTG